MKHLKQRVNFGGEMKTIGSIIKELQGRKIPQKYIDAYLMGIKIKNDSQKES